MAEYGYMFGSTPCEIHVLLVAGSLTGDVLHVADLYVVESDGHHLRQVGDANSKPLKSWGSSEDEALERAIELLERRFGPKGESLKLEPLKSARPIWPPERPRTPGV